MQDYRAKGEWELFKHLLPNSLKAFDAVASTFVTDLGNHVIQTGRELLSLPSRMMDSAKQSIQPIQKLSSYEDVHIHVDIIKECADYIGDRIPIN